MRWSRYLHVVSGEAAWGLYSAATGAFVGLEKVHAEKLGELGPGLPYKGGALPPSVCAGLLHSGLLIEDETDELGRLRQWHDRTKYDMTSLSLTILPTLECNLRCLYCFEDKRPATMSSSTEEQVVKLVEDLVSKGLRALQVTWYGGEPLLRVQTIKRVSRAFGEVLGRVEGTSLNLGVITNGTLLTPNVVEELESVGVRKYQVTLDGGQPIHDKRRPMRTGAGSFERILSNLKQLSARDSIAYSIRVNVDRESMGHVEPLIDFLASNHFVDQNVHRVYVSPVQYWGQGGCLDYPSSCFLTDQEFADYELGLNETVYRKYGLELVMITRPRPVPCAAVCQSSLVIGPAGELYKCWTDVGAEACMTGHLEVPLRTGPHGQYAASSPFESSECRVCPVLPLCGGGCPARPMRGLETITGHSCSRDRYRLDRLLHQHMEHRLKEAIHDADRDPSS